jgi:hypothetical protein
LSNFYFLLFKNNFTRINHCSFIHHKSHLKPFVRYLPSIACREYFSIIFNAKKCALYLIKYGNLQSKYVYETDHGVMIGKLIAASWNDYGCE